MAGKFMRIIKKTIPTLTLIVIASQLFGCGAANSKQISDMLQNKQEITIEYADQGDIQADEADCLSSSWLPLSEKSDNPTFRESFNTLTHNRTSNQKKEGTIYYLENPTLATSLKNSAFVSIFDNLNSSELLSLVSDLYLDLDETTSPDILKAAVINTYFDLFNTKQSQSQNEFNATQRISRVDFISAVVKSTTSPQSNEENLSESEIMLKLADKSYLGVNNTNNTETGIITKAEAAYMIASCMFNNEISEQKASKPAENLQACLESSELSSDLKESLKILESKGIIDESFVANWNKALTKSEAVDLIYKGLKVAGLSSEGVVNEDVIAEEEAARVAKLNKAKEDCKQYISEFSLIDQDSFNAQIDEATSEDELASIKESADEANKNAQEQMIKDSQSSNPSRRGFSITTTTGGPDTGSGSGTGTSGGGYTRNTDLSGLRLDNGDGNTELEHGQGGYNLK